MASSQGHRNLAFIHATDIRHQIDANKDGKHGSGITGSSRAICPSSCRTWPEGAEVKRGDAAQCSIRTGFG
jgi:hypothetical protein